MNPRDFHDLAKELIGTNNAAKTRTAISRAYYAAYLTGIEVLNKMGFNVDGFGGHGTLRDHFNNSGDSKIIDAGIQLANLHNDRIKADYKFNDNRINRKIESRKTAESLIKTAKEIILTLDLCLLEPSRRSKITQAIQDYRNKIPAYKKY